MSADLHQTNKIGVFGAAAYVIGNVIGSGIFITPTGILRKTNSVGLSLIIWIVSGAISAVNSFVNLELGTSIRESGGDFTYLCYVKWYPIAFSFLLNSVLIMVKVGVLSMLTGLLTFVNLLSLGRYANRLQILFTSAKVLAMLTLIITGFYFLIFGGWSKNFSGLMNGSNYDPGTLTLAVYGGLFAYGGTSILNAGIEEIKNPRRTLTLAMLGGMVVITLLYLSISVAYFAVLSKEEMLASGSVAVAQQFAVKVLGKFSYAFPVIIGIVLCGTTNSVIFQSSRYMFAAARRGHLPSFLGTLNIDSESPRASIVIFCLLTMVMTFVGDIDQLINYVLSLGSLQSLVTGFVLLWIRYKKIPVHKEAIRFNLIIPILNFIISALLVAIPIYQQPIESAVGVGFLLSGIVVYYLLIKFNLAPKFLHQLNDASLVASQKLFLSVPDLSLEVRRRRTNTVTVSDSISESANVQKY